jgi:hypothetical protein
MLYINSRMNSKMPWFDYKKSIHPAGMTVAQALWR